MVGITNIYFGYRLVAHKGQSLCLLCLCARLFLCALWSPARKGLTSWLFFCGALL